MRDNSFGATFRAVLAGPGHIEARKFPMPEINRETAFLRVEMTGI